jgi:Ca2+-binding EF-hand superfamily protein
MGDKEAEDEVEKIFKMVDKNHSGAIDYTGF